MRTPAGGRKTARSRSTTASTTRADLRPGDRSPRSPRNANALGSRFRGRFVFRVRKGVPCTRARIFAARTVSLTRSSPTFRSIQRERPDSEVRARVVAARDSATRRASAASRCSMRAAAGNAWAHGLPVGDGRQCEASIERSPAARVSRPSGARGAAVAYAGDRKTVFRQDGVSSVRESSGSAAGRRFDSGTSMDSSVG